MAQIEEPDKIVPANDNTNPDGNADTTPWQKLDKVVLSIAGLIGRQIAREHFEAARAANDNKPPARQTGARDDRSSGDDDP